MTERPADLLLWFKDGSAGTCRPRVKADVTVSVGRTDSKRALGFVVRNERRGFAISFSTEIRFTILSPSFGCQHQGLGSREGESGQGQALPFSTHLSAVCVWLLSLRP
jgi:hypothetical protein